MTFVVKRIFDFDWAWLQHDNIDPHVVTLATCASFDEATSVVYTHYANRGWTGYYDGPLSELIEECCYGRACVAWGMKDNRIYKMMNGLPYVDEPIGIYLQEQIELFRRHACDSYYCIESGDGQKHYYDMTMAKLFDG